MSHASTPVETPPAVESPPPAPQPAQAEADDPRVALNRLAATLAHHRSTRFLIEYLRLRRLLRA